VHTGGQRRSVRGLDLEVLGGVGVDDVEPLVEVVDQDDPRLPATERGHDPLGVPGGVHLLLELGLDVVGEPERVGDEHARRLRVVLGLADQVGRDVRRVGGVVGEDRDLGRAGLGVDADPSLEQTIRGDRVDVARAGDQVDRRHGPAP
jgi:hypothetical protein